MIDGKLKARLIQAIRKLSYGYKPRTDAKNKHKVGPACYSCVQCKVWIYEGAKTLDKLKFDPNKRVLQGKVKMDHIIPVVDPKLGWQGWDSFITRMFCEEDNYQVLCAECHKLKTEKERSLRTKTNKKIKKKR